MQLSFTITVAVVAVPHTLIDKSTMIPLMMFTSPHLNQAVAHQTPAMAISSHANFPEKSEGDKPGNEATVERAAFRQLVSYPDGKIGGKNVWGQ